MCRPWRHNESAQILRNELTRQHPDWLAAIKSGSWLAHQVGGVADDIGVAAVHMEGGRTICEQVQKETEHKWGL